MTSQGPRKSWGLPKIGSHTVEVTPNSRITAKASSNARLGGALNDYACPGNVLAEWLNRTDVRAALHVGPDWNFFSGAFLILTIWRCLSD